MEKKRVGKVIEKQRDKQGGKLVKTVGYDGSFNITKVAIVQALAGTAVAMGLWVLPRLRGTDLIFEPVKTLQFILILTLPVELIAFSMLRIQPNTCTVLWAMLRGLVSLPLGALAAAFMAIVFGAPVSLTYAARTVEWSLLISTLTVVPAAVVLGTKWSVWHRLFASTKPSGPVEIAICVPAHGAAIGAWVGAWPMPLDWDRPWQEWPISCTYGAVVGYLLSLLVSLIWSLLISRQTQKKTI